MHMEHIQKPTISEEEWGYTSFATFYLYAISYLLHEISCTYSEGEGVRGHF
jgi:hypothetical protein